MVVCQTFPNVRVCVKSCGCSVFVHIAIRCVNGSFSFMCVVWWFYDFLFTIRVVGCVSFGVGRECPLYSLVCIRFVCRYRDLVFIVWSK